MIFINSKIRIWNSKEYKSFSLRIVVNNTSAVLADWLHQICGYLYQRKPDARSGGKKIVYNWNVGDKQAGEVLEVILPYLKIKRQKAEAGIAFQSLQSKARWKNLSSLNKELKEFLKNYI